MIEAPEARVLAAQLTDKIIGLKITDVMAGYTPHKFAFFNGSTEQTELLLTGRTVTGVRPIGGQVEITAERVRLVFSDGGHPRYHGPGAELPPKHQLLIGFDDNSCLTFHTQMYGMFFAFEEDQFDNEYYRAACERPNVFSPEFTLDYFQRMATDPGLARKTVKALLATQQRIPGLGNGVLQDILLKAKIHPQLPVGKLSQAHITTLYATVVELNREMLRLGGRDCEKDLFGNKGKYRVLLGAKSLEQPCPVCGGVIERKAFLGGNVYYCTTCQPL